MKQLCLLVLIGISCIALLTSRAQTPAVKPDDQALVTLVKEVQVQQAQIVENQKKIESKLAEIDETVRVSRIFAARSE